MEVRRVTVADISAAKVRSHERGWDDADLDAIGLLPSLITACSDGDVTQEFVDSLTETDYGNVWLRAKGVDLPNPSAPSSAGGTRRGSAKTKDLTSG